MKSKIPALAIALAVVSIVVSVFAISRTPEAHAAPEGENSANPLPRIANAEQGGVDHIEARIASLESAIGIQQDGSNSTNQIDARLSAIEATLARLQKSLDGISLEEASAERDQLFRSKDGYLKADEYFAAEKFAIAGEGYLAFLEEYPDHPNAYDILRRARDAFGRAGYPDKSIWAQKELLRNFGDNRTAEDVLLLAKLEKDAGRYDDAITHAQEAADLSTQDSNRLWNRMYWAWYNQLRDGNSAGLAAYREVEQEIIAGGFQDDQLGTVVRERIDKIEGTNSASR